MGVLKFLGVSWTRQPDYGNKDAYVVPAATIAGQAFKNRSCFPRSTVVQLQAPLARMLLAPVKLTLANLLVRR
jgi:hypothetical protein